MKKMAEDEDVSNSEGEGNKGGHDDDPELLLLCVIVFDTGIFVEEIVLQHQLDSIFEQIAKYLLIII